MRKRLAGALALGSILVLAAGCGLTTSMGTWVNIGPAPIHQFAEDCIVEASPCFNGVTGRVDGIALAPGGAIYLATAGGGIWKSTNGGRTFSSLDARLPFLSIGAIAVDPGHPDVIYAGTGTDSQVSGVGVLRSNDGGRTWTTLGADLFSGENIYALLVTPGAVLVGADSGVYRSADGGRTWSETAPGKATSLTGAGQAVYAAIVGRGIERSTDDGRTWTLLANGIPTGTRVGYGAVAAAPEDPATVYASLAVNPDGALLGVYVSHDGGAAWTNSGAPDYSGPDNDLNYATAIAVSPTDPNVVDAGGYYLVGTRDGGRSWSSLSDAPPVHVDIHAAVFTPSGNLLLGTDGGLFEVPPPSPKVQIPTIMPAQSQTRDLTGAGTLSITQVYDVTFLPDGKGLAIGTQDNGFAIYSGGRWRSQFGGDVGQIVVNDASDFVLADDSDIGTLTATPVGGSFVSVAPRRASLGFLPPLAGVPGTRTLFTGGMDVWRSTDEGETWQDVSRQSRDGGFVTAIAVAPSDPRVIYAGWSSGEVRMSADGGRTWRSISADAPPTGTNTYVSSIAVSPSDPYAAAISVASSFPPLDAYETAHIFETPNAAGPNPTWSDIGGSLPHTPVNALLWDGGRLLCGTGQGVYVTADGGATWGRAGRGMPAVDVLSLALSPRGTIAAGTFGLGVWLLSGGTGAP